MESAAGLSLETSKVESIVRNQAEAKLNQLEHDEPAETMTTSCKRLKRKVEPAVAIQEEEESQAGAGAMKKSAGALSVDDISSDVACTSRRKRSDVVEEAIQSQATVHQQMLLEIAIEKRYRLHKLIRQRFALALKIQQEDFALINHSQDPVASYSGSRRKQQKHPVESLYESAVAMNTVASSTHPVASFSIQTQEKKKQAQCRNSTSRRKSRRKIFSRSDKSAAKQLTIYESWMSTAERNSNGESDKTQSKLKMERING
ncbi:hypothetical protein F511_15482 [Dorcoceras hygrometricum]|uniref:Uncharacterized protein n=1 Tax=Dorcoceras hygrometricum TaxID=472368 RepID=A0A2Z7CPZ0_9LAMI|nr:hypothetical protein F511_15482 [Dorcoceras hygrometricum]